MNGTAVGASAKRRPQDGTRDDFPRPRRSACVCVRRKADRTKGALPLLESPVADQRRAVGSAIAGPSSPWKKKQVLHPSGPPQLLGSPLTSSLAYSLSRSSCAGSAIPRASAPRPRSPAQRSHPRRARPGPNQYRPSWLAASRRRLRFCMAEFTRQAPASALGGPHSYPNRARSKLRLPPRRCQAEAYREIETYGLRSFEGRRTIDLIADRAYAYEARGYVLGCFRTAMPALLQELGARQRRPTSSAAPGQGARVPVLTKPPAGSEIRRCRRSEQLAHDCARHKLVLTLAKPFVHSQGSCWCLRLE